MNSAIFAIPGLMPPKAVNWRRQLFAPEDGSLLMLIHCGYASDTVNYAILRPGTRRCVLKDPGYKFLKPDWETTPTGKRARDKWPQYLVQSDTLPDGILIPMRKVHGCPIPITELTEADDSEKQFFYLELPPRTLPRGDSEVQVCVNGKTYHYIVQRKHFIVRRDAVRHAHRKPGEAIHEHNVSFTNTAPFNLYIDVPPGSRVPYTAYAKIMTGTFILDIQPQDKKLKIIFDTDLPVGTGEWYLDHLDTEKEQWSHYATGKLVVKDGSAEEEGEESND